jgi:hypothetical protein
MMKALRERGMPVRDTEVMGKSMVVVVRLLCPF